MLARMFSPDWPRADPAFIDRDGRHFHVVLNFLRDGGGAALPSLEEAPLAFRELLKEAE